MTRRQHDQGTWELLQEQERLRRVPCPPPPGGCGAPTGVACVRFYRAPVRERDDVHRRDCPAPPVGCGAEIGD
ncbi:MAG: hypothetical protein HOV94_05670, partial [Saccharothrix sp.]|nr:hypothetical protein [Saccharothrix sp.]